VQFKDNLQQLFKTKTIESTGVVQGKFKLAMVTSDIDEAIKGIKYILIVVPAFAHNNYAKLLKGKVDENQVIVLYPGAFGALLFKTVFKEDRLPVIAEVNNLPYDTRVTESCKVAIHGLNPVNIAFMPAQKGDELVDEIREIHLFEKVYDDVLESGLSIVNPGVHAGPCVTSISAIENWPKRTFFLYEHGITPGAMKINLKIDLERKAIGKKFGYHITSTEDFSGLEPEYSWKDLYMAIHGNISLTPISGPHDIYSRYFTEDAACGLVPWSMLGKIVGVETSTIDSVVNIYSIIHETDWWKKGRNATDLGLSGMTVTEIKSYLKTGNK